MSEPMKGWAVPRFKYFPKGSLAVTVYTERIHEVCVPVVLMDEAEYNKLVARANPIATDLMKQAKIGMSPERIKIHRLAVEQGVKPLKDGSELQGIWPEPEDAA